MKQKAFLVIAIVLSLCACRPIELERKGIPVFWGMRFDEGENVNEFLPNFHAMEGANTPDLLVEIPLKADSLLLPRIPDLPFSVLDSLAHHENIRLHLAVCTTNSNELFPGDSVADPDLWFETFESECRKLLSEFHWSEPQRLVLGNNFSALEQEGPHWIRIINLFQSEYGLNVSYGLNIQRVKKVKWLNYCNEIAVDFPPSAEDNLKAFSRTWNTELSRIADSLDKPVFIYRTNIVGDDPLSQFKNRLRFWNDDIRINGLCLNTLYPKISLRDSTTYYGLGNKPDFLQYLDRYIGKGVNSVN